MSSRISTHRVGIGGLTQAKQPREIPVPFAPNATILHKSNAVFVALAF